MSDAAVADKASGHDDHSEREIQRPLMLVTPELTGPDVKKFQEGGNDFLKKNDLRGHCAEDGVFGTHTRRIGNRSGWALGLDPKGGGPIGPVFTQEEQRLIRDPDSRSQTQKERSKRRIEQLHVIQQQHDAGADAAVKYAFDKIGTEEVPPGSNRGPLVDMWTQYAGLAPPVYWCGCFAGYCAVHEGGANCSANSLIHNEVMLTLARAGGHGLIEVSWEEQRAGDIVSYTFAHIGLIVGEPIGGRLHTIEGNTSETGHVSNGGGVFEHKDRSPALVLGIVRPDYSKAKLLG